MAVLNPLLRRCVFKFFQSLIRQIEQEKYEKFGDLAITLKCLCEAVIESYLCMAGFVQFV